MGRLNLCVLYMYAIITFSGTQYKVQKNDIIKVQSLQNEVGTIIDFDKVILISNFTKSKIGTPYLNTTKVTAEVIKHVRDRKIIIFKKKKRNNDKKSFGHRQYSTFLKINSIVTDIDGN